MKRLLILLVLVLFAFLACASAEEAITWPTRNIPGDEFIFSVRTCGDRLYGLLESGLYTISASGEKTQVTASADLPEEMAALLSDGESLYAVLCGDGQAELLRLTDREGNSRQDPVLSFDCPPEADFMHSVIRNGSLFYAVSGTLTTDSEVARISLSDASDQDAVTVRNLVCFDVMPDGDLLALTREAAWPKNRILLQVVSPGTGNTDLWSEVTENVFYSDVLYDDARDTAYLISQRTVYRADRTEAPRPVESFSAQEIISACLLPDGLAQARETTLNLCSFSGEMPEQSTVLTICGPYADNEYFTDFYESHPAVNMRIINNTFTEEPEGRFVKDMLTQSPEVDIYILHDLNLLKTIRDKSYYYDLSESDVIREKTARMYPNFIRLFTADGKITAFPHPYYVSFWTINYNQELFADLNLAVPTTWEEYFDFCLVWKEQYEAEYPEISVNPFDHDVSLVSLLACYDDETARAGIPADFRSEELERTLRRYLKTRELYADEICSDITLFYEYDVHAASDGSNYIPLPLTFVKDADPIYTPADGDIFYFVVNPFSRHLREAVECVASAREKSRANDPYIYTNIPDLPFENEHYEEILTLYRYTLKNLESRREKAEDDAESLPAINEEIELITKELRDFEENGRWWFTEEDMTAFREVVNSVYFSDNNLIKRLYADDPGFFDNVTEDTLPGFLNVLNNKVKMIRLEQDGWPAGKITPVILPFPSCIPAGADAIMKPR